MDTSGRQRIIVQVMPIGGRAKRLQYKTFRGQGVVVDWPLSHSRTQMNGKQNYFTRVWTGSWGHMIINRQLPGFKVGRIVGSPALSSGMDIRSLLTNFPWTATVDHGSIPDRAQVTAVSCILATGELALRIYFIRDGKLVEIWWTQKAGRNAWYMHDATAPGVSAVSSTDDVNVFFQAKTEYLSDLGINRHVIQWQFTAII